MKRTQRKIDYLRVSVTDKCNLMCKYCMPNSTLKRACHNKVLPYNKLLSFIKVFAGLGGRKIRITGGEPLLREGISGFIKRIKKVPGIEEVCITTNGILLSAFADELLDSGIDGINISLDTLRNDRFKTITGKECLSYVLMGIKKLKDRGYGNIKINTVILKDLNDDEIIDFINFAIFEDLTLRFIELMSAKNVEYSSKIVPIDEIKRVCSDKFVLAKEIRCGASPAEYYQIGNARIGFISTNMNNCSNCNRLRITSDGRLKVCLYENESADVSGILRSNDHEAVLRQVLGKKIREKADINYKCWEKQLDCMPSIGG